MHEIWMKKIGRGCGGIIETMKAFPRRLSGFPRKFDDDPR
jgi:hypothetical protein